MRNTRLIFFIGILSINLCSFFAVAERPTTTLRDSLPQSWDYTPQFTSALPDDDNWWRKFNDPTLDALIELGVRNNYDIAIAAKRIEMAKNSLAAARSGYYPQFDLSAGWTKDRSSGVMVDSRGHASKTDFFNLGVSMNWEIDVFGKIRAGVKAGESQYKATRAEYDAAMIAMTAQIAISYMNLRMYQQELEIARSHNEQQEKVLKITEARMDAGIGNALEVAQSKIVVYSTRATVPQLENSIAGTINAIAQLVGLYPREIDGLLTRSGDSAMPDYRHIVGVGVPIDLLRRRPDILESEMQLAAYAAQLGIAKKDFLPTISISGNIGTEAHDFGDLFSNDSFTYSIAPTLTWTIFDGLKRTNNAASARRQMEIGIDSYNQIVLTAFIEVDNAMSSYNTTVSRISLLENTVEQSQKAFELSLNLYKQGLSSFTNVVDAQLNILQYRNGLVEAKCQALISLIDLYKALGGGWQ